jgi:hypothetical protein
MRKWLLAALLGVNITVFSQEHIVANDSFDFSVISFLDTTCLRTVTCCDSVYVIRQNDTIMLKDEHIITAIDSFEIINGEIYPPIIEGLLYYSALTKLPKIVSACIPDSNNILLIGYRENQAFLIKSFIVIDIREPERFDHYALVSLKNNSEISINWLDGDLSIDLLRNGMYKQCFYEVKDTITNLSNETLDGYEISYSIFSADKKTREKKKCNKVFRIILD